MENKKDSYYEFNELRALPVSEVVARLQEKAAKAKAHFLSFDTNVLTRDNLLVYGTEVHSVYQATALFPDDEVIQRLKGLGLKDAYLIWFKPVKEVLTHFNQITADGTVHMNQSHALLSVLLHLESKISIDILSFLKLTGQLHDNPYAPRFAVDIHKLYRRIKRAIKLDRPLILRNEYDHKLYELIQHFEEVFGEPALAEVYFMQMAMGNTRKTHLRDIVMDCTAKVKGNAFYRSFFPLFQLICPDEELLSEYDFIRRDHDYGRSYAAYQAKRVKDLIRLGKKG